VKHLLLFVVRAYWHVWPENRKRCCLFRESCSRHVYRVTCHDGLLAGVRALFRRIRLCRGGYSVTAAADGFRVSLVDGTVISGDEASPVLVEPFCRAAERLKDRLNRATPASGG